MITLEKLLTELKAESLNEIIAGGRSKNKGKKGRKGHGGGTSGTASEMSEESESTAATMSMSTSM